MINRVLAIGIEVSNDSPETGSPTFKTWDHHVEIRISDKKFPPNQWSPELINKDENRFRDY